VLSYSDECHRFSKHATCTSTFDVACYGPNYKKNQDVVDFFQAVVRAYQQFPTYDFLASAGILPSNKTAYALADIQQAIASQTGAVPYLGCSGANHTQLSEVWYFSHVYGTGQFGKFKVIDSTSKSSCNTTQNIWYYERTPSSEREVRLLP
jgi:ribonuclease T2